MFNKTKYRKHNDKKETSISIIQYRETILITIFLVLYSHEYFADLIIYNIIVLILYIGNNTNITQIKKSVRF